MKKVSLTIFLICSLSLAAALWASSFTEPSELTGGSLSVFVSGKSAFERHAPNVAVELAREFKTGDSLFEQNWVAAPGSASRRDGLGPLFNARACSSCHTKDGRGRPHSEDILLQDEYKEVREPSVALLFRLSTNDENYGAQFQPHSIGRSFNKRGEQVDVYGEGEVLIEYELLKGQYADGETYELRKPTYVFSTLHYGNLSDDRLVSPRIAPANFGLGLLEALSESEILKRADPNDKDGDGISGRPNFVWDHTFKKKRIGRFGWKANQPSLRQQNAAAFVNDMGITNPVFLDETCSKTQTSCRDSVSGKSENDEAEISREDFERVVLYTHLLAVPVRRDFKRPEVREGERLFSEIGCEKCHASNLQTDPQFEGFEVLRNQKIRPYTDLLLHDMGEGLADNSPDGEASGREWRTAPLWGMGLYETVNGHTYLLHDGRARNAEEAILWHGGEAAQSKERFKSLSSDERQKLLLFLNSL